MPATTPRAVFTVLLPLAWCATASAGDAVSWLDVSAERPVDHAVMVRGPFAPAHEKVTLTGPVAVVTPEPARAEGPSFTAYRIATPADEPARTVRVGDAGPIRLGAAEFLLVPATRLADGPAAAADGAGVYEVRPILDPPDRIAGAAAGGQPPTHVCLPVDYRHHVERVAVVDAGRGLVLGAARAADAAPAAVSVVDDFGTNRLAPGRTARTGAWITVRAGEDP